MSTKFCTQILVCESLVSLLNNFGLLGVCKLSFTHSGALVLYFKGVLEEALILRACTTGIQSSNTSSPTPPLTPPTMMSCAPPLFNTYRHKFNIGSLPVVRGTCTCDQKFCNRWLRRRASPGQAVTKNPVPGGGGAPPRRGIFYDQATAAPPPDNL